MGFLASLLLGLPGLAEKLLAYLQKRADVQLETHRTDVAGDTAINVQLVQGWVEAQKAAAAARAADRGSLWTAWMMPAAFAIAVTHFGAVVFDSLPWFGLHEVGTWKIAALPGDYAELQRAVIYSAAGVVSTKSVAGIVGRVFTRRG